MAIDIFINDNAGNGTVINSGATYSGSVLCGGILMLPNEDVTLLNETGGTINTISRAPLGNVTITATTYFPPVDVFNSGNTYNETVASGGDLELPNITHIDSNGSAVTLPAQTSFTATTCPSTGLTDPSSFSDSIALYKSSAGVTLVSGEVDEWADQSGNGYDLSAAFVANRIAQVPNRGAFGFKDVWLRSNNRFETSTFASGSYTELTLDFIFTPTDSQWWFCLGDGNDPNYTITIFTGGGSITVATETGGAYVSQSFPYDGHEKICLGTIVFDGSETGADRIKFYLDDVEVSPTASSGTIPATLPEPDSLQFVLSAWSGVATGIVGYVGIWDRALSGAEITENNNWKNQIWS